MSALSARRRLVTALVRLRTDAGLTQRQAADQLEWSTAKVLRIESGQVRVGTTDLRALLAVYGLVDPERIDQLVELARSSRPDPYTPYQAALGSHLVAQLRIEAAATTIAQFEPVFVPGMLQTVDYARLVVPPHQRHVTDLVVAAQQQRQQVLHQPNPPACRFVLGPDVLRHADRAQLRHLSDLTTRPGVSVRVLPPDAAGPATDAFSLYTLDDGEEAELWLAADQQKIQVRRLEAVISYCERFALLYQLAAPFGYPELGR